jgi:hypothetical protein
LPLCGFAALNAEILFGYAGYAVIKADVLFGYAV